MQTLFLFSVKPSTAATDTCRTHINVPYSWIFISSSMCALLIVRLVFHPLRLHIVSRTASCGLLLSRAFYRQHRPSADTTRRGLIRGHFKSVRNVLCHPIAGRGIESTSSSPRSSSATVVLLYRPTTVMCVYQQVDETEEIWVVASWLNMHYIYKCERSVNRPSNDHVVWLRHLMMQ